MIKSARTIVRPARGRDAIRLGQQESYYNEPSSKPVLFGLTRAMFGRVALVVFICVYIAAHAWGIYKIETTLHAHHSAKDAAIVFGE
jgi:hypothetical protein